MRRWDPHNKARSVYCSWEGVVAPKRIAVLATTAPAKTGSEGPSAMVSAGREVTCGVTDETLSNALRVVAKTPKVDTLLQNFRTLVPIERSRGQTRVY